MMADDELGEWEETWLHGFAEGYQGNELTVSSARLGDRGSRRPLFFGKRERLTEAFAQGHARGVTAAGMARLEAIASGKARRRVDRVGELLARAATLHATMRGPAVREDGAREADMHGARTAYGALLAASDGDNGSAFAGALMVCHDVMMVHPARWEQKQIDVAEGFRLAIERCEAGYDF